MGLWITYVLFVSVFALMAWSVYRNHRQTAVQTVEESRSLAVGRLDAIDVVIVLVVWFSLRFVLGSFFDTLTAETERGLGLFLAAGAGAVWLRRRLSSASVIRFDPKNIAIRSAAVFSALAAVMALVFGEIAGWMDASKAIVWSFVVAAGALAALAISLHTLEFRRRPRDASEDVRPAG